MPETPVPSSPADPASSPSHGHAPSGWGGRQVEVKERPFIVGLLLTIVTLGIYPLFWHYLTHDELHRQVGRENKDKGLWYGYVAVTVIPFFIGVFLLIQFVGFMIAADTPEPSEEQLFNFFMQFVVWLVLLIVLGIVALVLFTIYALRQWELLKFAKERMGLQLRASAAAFFGLYYGGIAIQTLTSLPATIITSPIAYYFLQENYNDVPRALNAAQVEPDAYAPGGEGWQRGPLQPPSGGPAPVAFGAGYGGAQTSQYPQQQPQAPQPYGGMQSTSWDAPGAYGTPPQVPERRPEPGGGFSIRERPEEKPPERSYGSIAPSGATMVEQNFQCPRCHAHVSARGRGGESVTVHCPRCGESGSVRLPEA